MHSFFFLSLFIIVVLVVSMTSLPQIKMKLGVLVRPFRSQVLQHPAQRQAPKQVHLPRLPLLLVSSNKN